MKTLSLVILLGFFGFLSTPFSASAESISIGDKSELFPAESGVLFGIEAAMNITERLSIGASAQRERYRTYYNVDNGPVIDPVTSQVIGENWSQSFNSHTAAIYLVSLGYTVNENAKGATLKLSTSAGIKHVNDIGDNLFAWSAGVSALIPVIDHVKTGIGAEYLDLGTARGLAVVGKVLYNF